MGVRSTRSTVTFRHPFVLPGSVVSLPAGDYGLVIEEELLQGLSFEAYRRTATYLVVDAGASGRTEMHPVPEQDLQRVIDRDRALSDPPPPGSAG